MEKDPQKLNSSWRKTASTIYSGPKDSKLFGAVELDVTEAEKFIAQKRKEGIKVTMTHLLAMLLGRAVAEDVPELNTYVKRGRIVPRDSVDVMISVLINREKEEMSSVRVKHIDKLSLTELTEKLREAIIETRKGTENKTMGNKSMLASIPWPFRRWIFRLLKWISTDNGISIPGLGLSPDAFGSFILSNIGTVGLDLGFGALMPASSISMIVVMGKSEKKPVVINDEIVVRKMLSVGVTIDHRVVDGYHGGKLFRAVKRRLKRLEELEKRVG